MSRLPNSVAGWENPYDLVLKQSAATLSALLPQMIMTQGVLVDVTRASHQETSDQVYGAFSGQKLERSSIMRTRVLGLPSPSFRASKLGQLSGYFEGGTAYAIPTEELTNDDILVEVGTQAKWILQTPEVFGTAGGRSILRFRVANLME